MNETQGHFSWHELVTKDLEEAKGFYGELIGWTIEPMAMGDGSEYPLIKIGEGSIGGMATPPTREVAAHWRGYITVADVDATAAKVKTLGGETLMDAFDVPGVGRIQPVKDPQGAGLLLFTPEGDDPAAEAGRGHWHWNELWTKSAEKAAQFYCDAFGYSSRPMDMPNGTYFVLSSGGVDRAGIMPSPVAELPPHWAFYVEVDDVDATCARAEKLGGGRQGELMNMPGVGRFGFVTDREGARLGLITPERR